MGLSKNKPTRKLTFPTCVLFHKQRNMWLVCEWNSLLLDRGDLLQSKLHAD